MATSVACELVRNSLHIEHHNNTNSIPLPILPIWDFSLSPRLTYPYLPLIFVQGNSTTRSGRAESFEVTTQRYLDQSSSQLERRPAHGTTSWPQKGTQGRTQGKAVIALSTNEIPRGRELITLASINRKEYNSWRRNKKKSQQAA